MTFDRERAKILVQKLGGVENLGGNDILKEYDQCSNDIGNNG